VATARGQEIANPSASLAEAISGLAGHSIRPVRVSDINGLHATGEHYFALGRLSPERGLWHADNVVTQATA
jgi:hypothetical protein